MLIAPGAAASDAIVPVGRVLWKPIASPWELFDLFQEIELRLGASPSFLHLRSQLFRLRELAGLLQIPLEQQDNFIGVIGATEDLPPFGTSALAVGAIRIKGRLPPGIVRDGVFDK